LNINIHFSPNLAQFVLEYKIFETKFVDKIKTHTLY